MKTFDVIVVGLGAVGSAALYQLAKSGKKVVGIDQFFPPHTLGSSHGDTRITRQAIGEGAEYVPLVLRSYELWEELEKATGKELLSITGGLIMSSAPRSRHHGSSFFDQTVASAKQYGIAHSLLDAQDIRKKFPQFRLRGNERGYFEYKAGFLRPEACIDAQLTLAQKHGATIALGQKVTNFTASPTQDKVTIQTQGETYVAGQAIIAAGPWVAELLGDAYAPYFSVYRQILYWFDVVGPIAPFEPPNFPVWIWEFGSKAEDALYGFPAIGGARGGVKLASEQYSVATSPDAVSRQVTSAQIQQFYQTYVQKHFVGLSNTCLKAAACLYTVTPDHKFVIDVHPEFPQVIIASPCSGHGFKHSAAVGEVLSQMAIHGKSKIAVTKFSLNRFTNPRPSIS